MSDRAMITNPEAYFAYGCGRCDRFASDDCSTRFWLSGLTTLRRIARDVGLTETAKWGHPVYMHAARNIAIIGAFRDDFRLTFFNAALLRDQEGRLERQGPNSRHPDCLRFVDASEPERMETVIRGFLGEAMSFAEKGILPPKEDLDVSMPTELVQTLDADPELAEAFAALTPGRQRSWALFLSDARAPATRLGRIAKGREKILAGKGATER